MMILLHTLCEYETWYHAREIFTVLALVYLMRHTHC